MKNKEIIPSEEATINCCKLHSIQFWSGSCDICSLRRRVAELEAALSGALKWIPEHLPQHTAAESVLQVEEKPK